MTRREQTSGESRALILAAAAELFAEKGYRQTTFADVAARSGISRGSIPWHFGSKEGLLLAVLESTMEHLRGGLEAAGPQTTPEALVRALEALFRRPTAKLFVTLLVETLEPGSPIAGRYVAIHDALRDHCERWLRHVPLPPGHSPAALATAMVGAGIGIHQQWLVAPDRVDLSASLAAMAGMIAATVRA